MDDRPVARAPVRAEPTAPSTHVEVPIVPAPVRESVILVKGFDQAIPALGEWLVSSETASQIDPDEFYAKLLTPLLQSEKPLRYRVTARAEGTGWVGVGLHIFVTHTETFHGYGAGESILVWLTCDPRHIGDAETRLQVYRSSNATTMELEKSVIVPESVYDLNAILIEIDPTRGMLTVSINGNERLECGGFTDLKDGVTVIFRALDRATFQDFSVEELP
jgi:hypothetical protein